MPLLYSTRVYPLFIHLIYLYDRYSYSIAEYGRIRCRRAYDNDEGVGKEYGTHAWNFELHGDDSAAEKEREKRFGTDVTEIGNTIPVHTHRSPPFK